MWKFKNICIFWNLVGFAAHCVVLEKGWCCCRAAPSPVQAARHVYCSLLFLETKQTLDSSVCTLNLNLMFLCILSPGLSWHSWRSFHFKVSPYNRKLIMVWLWRLFPNLLLTDSVIKRMGAQKTPTALCVANPWTSWLSPCRWHIVPTPD